MAAVVRTIMASFAMAIGQLLGDHATADSLDHWSCPGKADKI